MPEGSLEAVRSLEMRRCLRSSASCSSTSMRVSRHSQPTNICTNGGEMARCTLPTGYDPRGRRTWCRHRRTIVHYDEAGRPMSAREWSAQPIGRSVRRVLAESPRKPGDMTVTIALVAPGTGSYQAQFPSSGGSGMSRVWQKAVSQEYRTSPPLLESGSVPREAGTGVQPAAERKEQSMSTGLTETPRGLLGPPGRIWSWWKRRRLRWKTAVVGLLLGAFAAGLWTAPVVWFACQGGHTQTAVNYAIITAVGLAVAGIGGYLMGIRMERDLNGTK